jgi:hypothetical protein
MNKKKDGNPAFPVNCEVEHYKGMSLRDYYAGQALAGLAAQVNMPDNDYARMAFKIADAMLAAREGGK